MSAPETPTLTDADLASVGLDAPTFQAMRLAAFDELVAKTARHPLSTLALWITLPSSMRIVTRRELASHLAASDLPELAREAMTRVAPPRHVLLFSDGEGPDAGFSAVRVSHSPVAPTPMPSRRLRGRAPFQYEPSAGPRAK